MLMFLLRFVVYFRCHEHKLKSAQLKLLFNFKYGFWKDYFGIQYQVIYIKCIRSFGQWLQWLLFLYCWISFPQCSAGVQCKKQILQYSLPPPWCHLTNSHLLWWATWLETKPLPDLSFKIHNSWMANIF